MEYHFPILIYLMNIYRGETFLEKGSPPGPPSAAIFIPKARYDRAQGLKFPKTFGGTTYNF